MVQWLRLESAGRVVLVDGKPTLAQMQAAVGGYVERMPLGHGCELWVNEDARMMTQRPVPNGLAGEVMCLCLGNAHLVDILGDALLRVAS